MVLMLRSLWLAAFALFFLVGSAVADPLDDGLTKLLDDAFPQTLKAVGDIAGSGAPQAAAILEAMSDNRLLIDAANKRIVIEAADGSLTDAKTGAPIKDLDASSLKKVRVNNAIRTTINASVGGLSLANADPAKRLEAAQAVFKSRDAKALPALEAQIGKEKDPRVLTALEQARAAVQLTSPDTKPDAQIAAIQVLAARGDDDAQALIAAVAQSATDPDVKKAAASALVSIQRRLAILNVAQNLYYGLSASSVLLLAAIGLAITFGVMGVINMAHGEMAMLGAYVTFMLQSVLPPALQPWSLALAIPAAFIVSGAVGAGLERLVIRRLYSRPLETLLATWGISLILQQGVRTLFGANNREVTTPDFMSGGFDLYGLSITYNRLWIIALAVAVFVGIQAILRLTSFGLQMRAVTQNRRMAAAMGISTSLVDTAAFALGSGVAGIAGVALSQIDNVSPNLGQGYIIDSFMVVVFGGVGNLWGTAFGALLIGLANKLLEPLIGAVQGQIVLLVFIILFIQRRPRGLFALRGRAVEA
jgi:urea transport system permease protein